jgi:hypothetical protein
MTADTIIMSSAEEMAARKMELALSRDFMSELDEAGEMESDIIRARTGELNELDHLGPRSI